MNLKNKVNEQTEQKQTHRYREYFGRCLRVVVRMREKGEGNKGNYKIVTGT